MSSARRWARSAAAEPRMVAGSTPRTVTLVVLDFAEGGADDVGEADGGGPFAGWFDAGEDEEALGVAAHAGGEVVEAEEVGEGVGVGFVGFEFGDEVELAAEEVLVAAAEVDEAVGDVAAEDGLFDGEVEGGVLDGVEGVGDVGDFVAGVDADGFDGGHGDVVAEGGFEDVEDGVGEAVLGHLLGLAGQGPQRLGDRPRHQPRQRRGQDEGGHPAPAYHRWRAAAVAFSSSDRSISSLAMASCRPRRPRRRPGWPPTPGRRRDRPSRR